MCSQKHSSTVNILVVDDEPSIQKLFSKILNAARYNVVTVGDAYTARQKLTNTDFQVALMDVNLPDTQGLELLQFIKSRQPYCHCIVMTGYGSTKTAIQAIRLGAYDYVEKPFDSLEHMVNLINQAAQWHDSDAKQQLWTKIKQIAHQVGLVISQHESMQQILTTAYKIANKQVSVLITGETGTGKEVLARFIHAASNRQQQVFIPINCGAIHANLLESELFGHEKGAFTGAVSTKKGIFELAHQGTLFLDELAESCPAVQVKLLRLLETGDFVRLGGQKVLKADVRIIAATNANLERLVQNNKFRKDLFYRLDGVRFALLPLRQRVNDIPQLVNHFLQKPNRPVTLPTLPTFSDEALKVLMNYPWHGNIRELANVIDQLLAQEIHDVIGVKDLPPKLFTPHQNHTYHEPILAPGTNQQNNEIKLLLQKMEQKINRINHQLNTPVVDFKPRPLGEVEQEHIQKTLAYFNGNITLAAKALGISRATLYRKLNQ